MACWFTSFEWDYQSTYCAFRIIGRQCKFECGEFKLPTVDAYAVLAHPRLTDTEGLCALRTNLQLLKAHAPKVQASGDLADAAAFTEGGARSISLPNVRRDVMRPHCSP